ncbi:hypothetical protein XELAEV_18021449mg [Xenopus laevis]|uniref:Uncharacterized protein n=1 Tax=Xenopus laevis TaxID=8355 RepID=A0A974HRZ7_XENLA|nr:hypothetical protein XELAEV_18021449mg [Xenopus laevis]
MRYQAGEFCERLFSDNLPMRAHQKQAHKKQTMARLQRSLRRKFGCNFELCILQRMWSDMKRRDPDYVMEVQWDLKRTQAAQAKQEVVEEEDIDEHQPEPSAPEPENEQNVVETGEGSYSNDYSSFC